MAVDFEKLADGGMPAGQLAEAFLSDYAGGVELAYPLNPFQMLREMGVAFSFRPFRSYEGVYIPSEEPGDTPVVGINLRRPISRQRFTAAHELCHHLKDSHRTITCEIGSDSPIERYAESFAAHLLMPAEELSRQVRLRGASGKVGLDDVLLIAHHFGVSFQACLYRLAYDLHALEGDVSPKALDIRRREFKPDFRRETLGLTDLHLYEQLFDAADDYLELPLTPRTRQLFETEYVFHDSRMEGVEISQEKASEIVVDLRLHGNRSDYCRSENRNVIEVAGLSRAYDYVFDKTAGARLNDGAQADVSIYDARAINGELFSTAPHPEFGGRYRESNTLVIGTKFETVDSRKIQEEMFLLDGDVQFVFGVRDDLRLSDYIERVLDIQHHMTVIHPFRDGNGRTSRAFTNLLLGMRNMPPVLFSGAEKAAYKSALGKADNGDRSELYMVYFKAILESYTRLSGA